MKKPAAILFPYAAFTLLMWISWNRWIEPYVDSGRELMVPWRIAQGEALYRDVHFHHGPLAAYLGAAVDRLAGPSLAARTALAALLALLHLEGLRRLSLRFLSEGRASLATTLVVALAVFLRPGGWLFPFSFDTALAVTALTWSLCLARPTDGDRADRWVAIWLLAALLSRLELGAVGIVAVSLATRQKARRWLLLTLAPLTVAGAVYGALSLGISLEKLVGDGWLALTRPPKAFQNVYRAYAGLDRPGLRLAELAVVGILLLLLAVLLAAAAMAAARMERVRPRLARLVETLPLLLLAVAATLSLRPPQAFAETILLLPPLVRVVPVLVVGAALWRLARRLLSRREELLFGVPDEVLFVAALFGLRLLLAAGYVGPYNAFFLPLPLVVATAGLFRAAQSGVRQLGSSLLRLVGGAAVILLLLRLAALAAIYRAPGWSLVTTPAGSLFLREPVAWTTRSTLGDLAVRLPPSATLTGFPEAGFLNYVLRRGNPLPLEQFFPGHLDQAGERRVIRLLEQSPPDGIVLIDVLAVGEGARVFGKDYLPHLDRFLHQNFRTVAAFGPGARPEAHIGDPAFFIEIRVPRRSAVANPTP